MMRLTAHIPLLAHQGQLAAEEVHELEGSKRAESLSSVLSALDSAPQPLSPSRPSLGVDLICALVRERPENWREIAEGMRQRGVLRSDDISLIDCAMGFLDEIRCSLEQSQSAISRWTVTLQTWPEACRRVDDCLLVSLGFFRSVDLTSYGDGDLKGYYWGIPIVGSITDALCELAGANRYGDLASTTSCSDITAREFPAAVVAILFIAALLERIGADPDVRPAGRPIAYRDGNLIVRAGRVELYALTTWLLDPENTAAAATRTAVASAEAIRNSQPFEDNTFWWPRLSAADNIKWLWTNAGWYSSPERAATVFSEWAGRYQAALEAGALLVECAEDFQRVACILPSLRNKTLHDWTELPFLKFLDRKRVVFATAFAEEIQSHFESGDLERLWADAGCPAKLDSLQTVAAPMSVWPYMPHDDWFESFKELEAACLEAIDRSGADVFIASCGAYGLPIVHSVHGKRSLTGIYNGHASNCYFGIYTNDFNGRELHRFAAHSKHWRHANLALRYPSLGAIDSGRYILSETTTSNL